MHASCKQYAGYNLCKFLKVKPLHTLVIKSVSLSLNIRWLDVDPDFKLCGLIQKQLKDQVEIVDPDLVPPNTILIRTQTI